MTTRREFNQLAFGASVTAILPGCSEPTTLKTHSDPLTDYPDPLIPLKTLAAEKGRRFGTCIGNPPNGPFSNAAYVELIKRECDVLVAENEHKMYTVMPQLGVYDFTRGDALVQFGDTHNIPMRGHTLLWDTKGRVPAWLRTHDFGSDGKAGMRKFLEDYIRTVCTHYGDKIESWDVVNEAINPYTSLERNTIYRKLAGKDLIEYCFHLAREHAPDARLVYNDFSAWDSDLWLHRRGVLRLLERLKARGVPIDAVGIQSHLGSSSGHPVGGYPDPQRKEWRKFMDEITGMGFDVLITEFDVDDRDLTADPVKRDQIMADYASAYLDLMLDYPQVKDVLAWGLSDQFSWLQHHGPRKDGIKKRPALYDAAFNPKPLRHAVARSFSNAPVIP